MTFELYPENREWTEYSLSIWIWPAVLELISQTNILPDPLLDLMATNDGAYVDAERAKQIADAIAMRLEGLKDDDTITITPNNDLTGKQFLNDVVMKIDSLVTHFGLEKTQGSEKENDAYRVEVGFLRSFVEFLYKSGGFHIY